MKHPAALLGSLPGLEHVKEQISADKTLRQMARAKKTMCLERYIRNSSKTSSNLPNLTKFVDYFCVEILAD